MTDWFDSRAVEAALKTAAMRALERGGARIVARAQELAPVRKVFRGQDKHYRVRVKSIEEIEADRGQRRALGLGPERTYINPPLIVTQRVPQHLTQREVVTTNPYTGRRLSQPQLRLPSAQARLDRRGRYELKSGRAVSNGQLGRHLRDQIHATPAQINGRRISLRIVSPAPYSKYQEFGTAHNPAHPYMRPAAHENRDAIMADVAAEIVREVTPLFAGRVDVVVPTKVRGGVAG